LGPLPAGGWWAKGNNMTKTKENNTITTIEPESELDVSESKEDKLIQAYLDCHDVREAGEIAGYSQTTLSSGYLYGKFQKPKFQEKFRRAAIAMDYQDLAFVYSLERKALQEATKQAKDRPESALENISKLKHTLKTKKQIIGILGQDPIPPQQSTINIESLKVFWQGVFPDRPEPKPVEEAEIIDTK
jgi:hypothetical protein